MVILCDMLVSQLCCQKGYKAKLKTFYIQILLHVTEVYQLLSKTSSSFRDNISHTFLNRCLVIICILFLSLLDESSTRQCDLLWMVRVLVYMFSHTGTTLRRPAGADNWRKTK